MSELKVSCVDLQGAVNADDTTVKEAIKEFDEAIEAGNRIIAAVAAFSSHVITEIDTMVTVDIQASCVWTDLGVRYYETPEEVTMNDDLMAELIGGPMAIYQRVLALAQLRSRPDIELTAARIRAIGVSKNYVRSSVDKLERAGLVKVTRKLGIGASFLFELLDPKTGLPILTLYERGKEISADRLTREQIIDYFTHRLRDHALTPDTTKRDQLRARCPFHVEANRLKQSLHIKLPAAASGSTTWKCQAKECPHNEGGSIIEFEVAISKELTGKTTNTSAAWKRIVGIMRGVKREEEAVKQAMEDIAREP